jgi:hypothetical protein
MLCRLRNLDREAERDDDEGLAAIGAHDQEIGAIEPRIQLTESGAAALHLDAAIDPEQRNRNIAAEAAARRAAQRHALSGKAGTLKCTHKCALGAVTFLARSAAAAHSCPHEIRSSVVSPW